MQTLVRQGEHQQLEFKRGSTSFQDLAAAVVCFANADGGLILWGIDKDGAVTGADLKDPDSLSKTLFHNTAPSQVVHVQAVAVGEATVVGIWVTHAPYLVSTRSAGYSQRVGDECVPMTPDRLLVRQIDTRTLDMSSAVTPAGPVHVDDLELERFRRLLPDDQAGSGLRRMPALDLLRSVSAVVDYAGAPHLTVAGLLVFGTERVLRDIIPQHGVIYLRSATGGTDYDRRVPTYAPMLALVDQLAAEVQAAGRVRRLRFGSQELELPDYPERVLREAIVNALAHRHLALPGDVVVRHTSTFIEIENPGGFPEGITADTVIQHAPVQRNKLLCEILDRVRYMERSGLGVDRIFEDQLRYGKLPPVYTADSHAVRLRIDASRFDEPFARFIYAREQAGRTWRVEDLLVLSYLRRMGPADRAMLARTMQRTEEEAQDILEPLLEDVIDRFGSGPASRYALSAGTQAALGNEAAYTRERGLTRETQRRIVIEHALRFGRIDNVTVRKLLSCDVREASALLVSLEGRGDLRQVGQKRWAYYQPARSDAGHNP